MTVLHSARIVSILVLHSSRWRREGTGCFALFFFLVSRVVWLFIMMPRVCLQIVIVVFPDLTHLDLFGL